MTDKNMQILKTMLTDLNDAITHGEKMCKGRSCQKCYLNGNSCSLNKIKEAFAQIKEEYEFHLGNQWNERNGIK